MNDDNPAVIASIPEALRLLKGNEIVRPGDFVGDGRNGFEPWVGPRGFRAAAFVKQVYRPQERRATGAKKQS